ncbi:MAG: hypothetical protein V5A55_02260 [Halovenus sp.]
MGDGQVSTELADTVASRLESGEKVEYRLPGEDDLRSVRDGGSETIPVTAGGQAFAIATDRKLLFAVETPNGGATVEIPYTDVRACKLDSGLLGATLRVEVWSEGTYEFTPSKSGPLEETEAFVKRISECWQRVVGGLEGTQDQAELIREHLVNGQLDAAEDATETARQKLERARERVSESGDGAVEVLSSRIDGTRRELLRTRMEARIERAEILLREAKHQTDATAYGGAYRSYERAREHLETALAIDIRQGFGRTDELQSEIADIETRIDHLEVRPMALALQARERAQKTDTRSVEVSAWQEAFEHYRDALTEGWGTDLDFSAREDELAFETECVVGYLIRARREYADELEAKADARRQSGDAEAAVEHTEAACDQLRAAKDLARQFRSGDPGMLQDRIDALEAKQQALH